MEPRGREGEGRGSRRGGKGKEAEEGGGKGGGEKWGRGEKQRGGRRVVGRGEPGGRLRRERKEGERWAAPARHLLPPHQPRSQAAGSLPRLQDPLLWASPLGSTQGTPTGPQKALPPSSAGLSSSLRIKRLKGGSSAHSCPQPRHRLDTQDVRPGVKPKCCRGLLHAHASHVPSPPAKCLALPPPHYR